MTTTTATHSHQVAHFLFLSFFCPLLYFSHRTQAQHEYTTKQNETVHIHSQIPLYSQSIYICGANCILPHHRRYSVTQIHLLFGFCVFRPSACLPACQSGSVCKCARPPQHWPIVAGDRWASDDMMLIAWSGLFHGIVSLALHPLYKDFAFCRNCFGVESQATTNNFIYAFMMRTESFDVADAVCCYVSAESRVQRQPTTTVPTLPSAIK